ncbi:hypothetical protein [Xanthomonas graminis]|uniref:hypothetical protein n=1 Tax=Xanthomonas graminis TaxID=3390026 RepID=UPI001112D5A4|nr:hypothetical protein [Xanthomonas translucens]
MEHLVNSGQYASISNESHAHTPLHENSVSLAKQLNRPSAEEASVFEAMAPSEEVAAATLQRPSS